MDVLKLVQTAQGSVHNSHAFKIVRTKGNLIECAEAANRKLYAELRSSHPVVWKFTEGIRKVQRGRHAYYEQLIAGKNPNRKLLKYIKADERVLNIVKQFDSLAPLEYLRGLAHNYDIN